MEADQRTEQRRPSVVFWFGKLPSILIWVPYVAVYMIAEIVRTARKQLTVRYGLSLVAFLALIYGFTREVETVVAIALGLVLVETIQILRETPSVDDRWVGVGIGTFVAVTSLAWLGYELTVTATKGGPVWFPALMALIDVWFLFDARKDFREGRGSYPDDDMTTSEMMLVMNHSHLNSILS